MDPTKYEYIYTLPGGLGGYYAFNKNVPDSIVSGFQKVINTLIRQGEIKKIIRSHTR